MDKPDAHGPRYIDRVVIGEERARMTEVRGAIDGGYFASNALDWFGEFGFRQSADLTLKVTADLAFASGTTNAPCARRYVEMAVREFHAAVLARAVELAWADYDAGVAARKADKP